jgi:hypothetical protein
MVIAAPLLLSGCEFVKKIFGGAEDAVARAQGQQSAWPRDPRADVREQGDIYSGRQLNRAADLAAELAGGETDPGRVTFDGGTLRDAVGAPVLGGAAGGVYAGDIRLTPRPPIAYTPGQARTGDLRTPAPPAPPNLTLPDGAAVGTAVGAGPTLAQYDVFQRMPGLFRRAYDVVSRAGWGAQAPRRAAPHHTPTKVTVHHTDGPRTTTMAESIAAVRSIQHYHRNVSDRRKGLWDDIGYHFIIDGAGRVFEGRHAEVVGSHARNFNTGNVGISLMGNFDRMQLEDAQRESLVRLVTFLSIRYRRDPSAVGFIEPHEHYAELGGRGTDCPGANVLAFLNSGELLRRASAEVARVARDSRFQPMGVIPAAT